jgi:hypothetical protein
VAALVMALAHRLKLALTLGLSPRREDLRWPGWGSNGIKWDPTSNAVDGPLFPRLLNLAACKEGCLPL